MDNEKITINDIITDYIDDSKFQDFVKSVSAAVEAVDERECNEVYAREVEKLISLIRDSASGSLYIYNLKGYYDKCEKWILQSLLKYIINNSNFYWKLGDESEIIAAIQRDCTKTVDCFNAVNAVNFRNGVFFLDNGEFREGVASEYYFNYILSYDYNPEADCPVFKKFIQETACGDDELIAVIQEMMGYCSSNETKAEKAFFLYGNGSNGKTVLSHLMSKLIGIELTCSISLKALDEKYGISDMIGKRLNSCGENECLQSSERFKAIVSGDRMNIPIKYKDDWVGALMIKNIFLMNSLPVTSDVTYGFFRKILILPFRNTITPDKMNVNLEQELETELSGIFNWAYEGYKRLVANNYNFTPCKVIDECMQEYAERENHTAVFFKNTYTYCEGNRIKKSDIYRDYQEWASNNGYTTLNKAKFYAALAIKAEEDKSIKLNYCRVRGINYLKDYNHITTTVKIVSDDSDKIELSEVS